MQIFYCDKCGMRIPQAQIDTGQAARLGDEKLACPACSKHVAPRPAARPQAKSSGIRLDAIQPVKNPASSGTLVPYRRPTRESGAAHDRHDRYGGHGHGAKGAAPASPMKLYAGVGIGIFVVLLGVIFASGGNKKVEADRRDTADIPRAKTAGAPATAQAKGPQLLTPPPRTTPGPRPEARTVPEPLPGPPAPDPQGNADADREDLAADAFDVLKKFEGLAEDDKDGRKRKIESFLESYADTMAGARARVLLQNLESGVSAVEPEDEPDPEETPAATSAGSKHVTETVEADGTRMVTLALPSTGSGGTEAPDGAMKTSSTYLNVGNADMKTVTFLHFPAFPVPPRAKILGAHIQFTCKYTEKSNRAPSTDMTIEAEAADDSAASKDSKIDGRARTKASVTWTVPPWRTTGDRSPDQRTPDLAALVQEVVDRPGWQANNAILFLISKGTRHSAYPRDLKVPSRSPTLTVRYREAGVASPETASGPAQPAVTGDAGLLQVLAVLAPELRRGEFEDAAERVDVLLKDPNFAGAAEALAREKRDLAAVLALREATIASLNEGGKAVKLNKGKLDLDGKTVRGADHTKVTVRVAGGLEMVVYAREFSAAEIARYAPQPRTADERRAHAYLHLASGDAAQAKAVLVEAGKNGDPGLQPYLDRLDLAALDTNSLKAKAAWLSVEKYVTDRQFAEADTELKAFKDAYGETAFARDMAATIKARAREIDQVINPYLPGLKGEYFKDKDLKPEEKLKERIDAKVDFHWDNDAPMAGVPQNFAVRWTGFLKVPKKGTYTLALSVDDGVRLYVDDNKLIDHWMSSPEKKHESTVDLEPGYHRVKLEFFDSASTAVCVFLWSLKDGFLEQVVPPEALWHHGQTTPGAPAASTAQANALKPVTLAPGEGAFLSDLPAQDVDVFQKFGNDGTVGFSQAKIVVNGVESPHGLSTHPFTGKASNVSYQLDGKYRQFLAYAAINHSGGMQNVPVTFSVLVDGNTAWTSREISKTGEHEACSVDVTGAQRIQLQTFCKGYNQNAHAVWFEPRVLVKPGSADASTDKPRSVTLDPNDGTFLSSIKPKRARVGGAKYAADGTLGYSKARISVGGVESPNGICTHPFENGAAAIDFELDRPYRQLVGHAAINDNGGAKVSLTFTVELDGKTAWTSRPLQAKGEFEAFAIDVTGAKVLRIAVDCKGSNDNAVAVWFEPRLLLKPQSPPAVTIPVKPQALTLAPEDGTFIAAIKPSNVVIGGGKYAADGSLGFSPDKIRVGGEESPHGICTHPQDSGGALVEFELDKPYRQFSGHAAIDDSGAPKVPLTFTVELDGKLAWTSRALQAKGEFEPFAIDVTGAKKLSLKVHCKGSNPGAVAVWFEPRLLQSPANAATKDAADGLTAPVFLSDLQETSATVVAGWFFGKKGKMGSHQYKNDPISANGVVSPNGINMTPPEKDKAVATYAIDRKYAVFVSQVAICDTSKDRAKSPAIFKVYGDDQLLWQSQPHQMTKVVEDCKVDVRSVAKLTLEVECPKVNLGLHAVWLEPRLFTSMEGSLAFKAVELKAGEGAYLSDLQESDVSVYGNLGKNGELGYLAGKIKVSGVDSPHGLGMHPNGNTRSRVTYRLDGKYRQFLAFAAISDTAMPMTPLVFSVEVDGKIAWTSQPLKARGEHESCSVDVTNAKSITLFVACNGPNDNAHAVWFEPHLLANPAAQAPANAPAQVYLSDLPEQDASVVANWKFGKKGQTGAPAGDKNEKILVAGFESPNGLGLHPPSNGKSHVAYKLDKKFRTFSTRVGLSDSSANKAASPVIFKILGDGKLLWQSKSIQKINIYDGCNLNVTGVEKLELEVECRGDASRCHAVWIEPVVNR